MQESTFTLAQKLKKIRKAKGRTVEEMASHFDMSPYHWRKFEMGYTKPSYNLLVEIAKFFNVRVDYFLRPGNHFPFSEEEIMEKVGRSGSVIIGTHLLPELEDYYAAHQR